MVQMLIMGKKAMHIEEKTIEILREGEKVMENQLSPLLVFCVYIHVNLGLKMV